MSNSPDLPPSEPREKENSKSSHHLPVSRWLLAILGLVAVAFLIGVGALVTKLTAQDKASPTPQAISAPKAAGPTRQSSSPSAAASPTVQVVIKVQVAGEVVHPAVYEMQTGDRIQDAINRAGGFTDQADPARLDLAQRVKDEMRIDVPRLTTPSGATAGSTTPSAPVKATSTLPPTPGDGKININTATSAELDKLLPGIGPTLAQRIVDYRTQNGPFKSVDDLRKITGLTKSVVEKIKDLISF